MSMKFSCDKNIQSQLVSASRVNAVCESPDLKDISLLQQFGARHPLIWRSREGIKTPWSWLVCLVGWMHASAVWIFYLEACVEALDPSQTLNGNVWAPLSGFAMLVVAWCWSLVGFIVTKNPWLRVVYVPIIFFGWLFAFSCIT